MNPSTYICNIEAVVRMGDGSLENSRGTGAAEKRWNTAAFNGHDKKANLRLDEVKFSSSEFINSICNMEAAARKDGVGYGEKGTALSKKRWSTVTFNGHDKKRMTAWQR